MVKEHDAPAFFDLMDYVTDADHDVIDMVSGNPDWGSPPGVADGLRDYADLGGPDFQYPPTEGLRALRGEIAERRNVSIEQIVVTIGGGEANYLAFALGLENHSGNTVALPDPVYPYYPGKAKMLGGDVAYYPVRQDGAIDMDGLRETVTADTAVVVVNSPNNPTGAVYPAEMMQRVVSVAEANNAMVVSDEAYDHLDLSGEFSSALAVDSSNRIVTNSYSKSLAITGFRVGYAIFPSTEMAAAARDRHMLTVTAGVRPSQHAVLHALRNTTPAYYQQSRALLRERIRTFTAALDTAGAAYTTPAGSFYVMTRFDGYPGTMENVKRLIDDAGVAGMPGSAFGESRAEWFRFALVTDRVDEAASRLSSYFSDQ